MTDAELLQHPGGLAGAGLRADHLRRRRPPVLIGEYVFPGHRTEFTVDLPHVEASIAPSGLRLVE